MKSQFKDRFMLRFGFLSDITREMFTDHGKLENLMILTVLKFLAMTSGEFMAIIF